MKRFTLLLILIFPSPYPFGYGLVDIISFITAFKFFSNLIKNLKINKTELSLLSFLFSPLIFNFQNVIGVEIINDQINSNITGYLGLWRSVLPFFFAKYFKFESDSVKKVLLYVLFINIFLGIIQNTFGDQISILVRKIWWDDFGLQKSANIASGLFGNYAYYAAGVTILIASIFDSKLLVRLAGILVSALNFLIAPILTYPVSLVLAFFYSNIRFFNLKKINLKKLRKFFFSILTLIILIVFFINFGPSKIKEFFRIIFLGQELTMISGSVGASFFYRINDTFIKNIEYFISSPFTGVGFSKAADSLWLGLLTTQGLIGFSLFISIFVNIYISRKIIKNEFKSTLEKNYFDFLLPSLIFSSITQFPIFGGLSGQIFWFISGVVYYNKNINKNKN